MDNLPETINIEDQLQEITEPWSPVYLLRFNDQVMRGALFRGEYHWHTHPDMDEVFLVVRGRIAIQMRGVADLVLQKGEMGMVPKGMEHCPKSDGDSYVLMIEPAALESEGTT